MAGVNSKLFRIRIVLVDDHRIYREGIRATLTTDARFDIVGEYENGESALPACAALKPELVLLDHGLPGLDGLEVARRLRQLVPRTRVVMLTMHEAVSLAEQARQAGAVAFVSKSASPAKLRAAVIAAVDRRRPTPRKAGKRPLTPREREVLRHVASGAASRSIAAKLGLAVRTIEKHRENLSRKLNLKGQAALTRYAIRCGLAFLA